MLVRAPHSSSLLTASVSAAIMAKKRTGMGTLDALGSAPRSSNSFRVVQRTRCLLRQSHYKQNLASQDRTNGTRKDSREGNRTYSIFMAAILRTVSCVSER